MNADARQRISDAVEREAPWPGDDDLAGHPFAADSEPFDEPATPMGVVMIVSAPGAPASLADRLAAVERVRALADTLADPEETYNACRAELHDAIDALAGIAPADRARAEGR